MIKLTENKGAVQHSNCRASCYADMETCSNTDDADHICSDCNKSSYRASNWDMSWYFSVRGGEIVHLYLWLLTDLSWVQSWYYLGHIFGFISILWCAYLLSHAIVLRNWKEIVISLSMLLWLNGNYVWMNGELHDDMYPNEPTIYNTKTLECRVVMEVALALVFVFYLILRPAKVLVVSPDAESIYDDSGLTCRRLPLSWRQYENLHVICWLAKDYCWNRANPILWSLMIVPTLCIGLDMLVSTVTRPGHLIENIHYVAQFIWVLANVVWAFGEIFHPENDSPISMFSFDDQSYKSFRWLSSWLLVVALLPAIVMYLTWMVVMMKGHLGYQSTEYEAIAGEGDAVEIVKIGDGRSFDINSNSNSNSNSNINSSSNNSENIRDSKSNTSSSSSSSSCCCSSSYHSDTNANNYNSNNNSINIIASNILDTSNSDNNSIKSGNRSKYGSVA